MHIIDTADRVYPIDPVKGVRFIFDKLQILYNVPGHVTSVSMPIDLVRSINSSTPTHTRKPGHYWVVVQLGKVGHETVCEWIGTGWIVPGISSPLPENSVLVLSVNETPIIKWGTGEAKYSREAGNYYVKGHKEGEWYIARWDSTKEAWLQPGDETEYSDEDMYDIDERPLTRSED